MVSILRFWQKSEKGTSVNDGQGTYLQCIPRSYSFRLHTLGNSLVRSMPLPMKVYTPVRLRSYRVEYNRKSEPQRE